MNKRILLGKTKVGLLIRSLMVILAVTGITGFSIGANSSWGPTDRPTFTIDEPADYVTFNSITDNPNYGDERNFFDAKPASNTSEGGFTNNLPVGDLNDGDEVLLRVYVHNNAADNYNESGEGIAKNTRVRVDLPEGIDRSMRAQAFISADNAQPQTVFDSLDFQSTNRPFDLTYVEGSAMLYTNPHPQGRQISDDIIGSAGAQIGYDEINGEVPGCFEYSALVTIKVKVSKADVSIDKYVREVGDTDWSTEISVDPGAEVEYLIEVENTGGTDLENVAVGDNLPNYIAYVDGTTQYANASTNFEPRDLGSDNIVSGGVDIGSYTPGSNAFVMFRADVDPIGAYDYCGDYVLRNVGIVRPFHDRQLMNQFVNTADIKVNIECEEPPETGELVCEDLSAVNKGNGLFQFAAKARTVGAADFNSFVYSFGDGSEDLVTEQNNVDHTFQEPGTYTARVAVRGTVVDEQVEVTSNDCKIDVTYSVKDEPEQPDQERPETPDRLPETGIGGVVGLFAATSAASAFAHRIFTERRGYQIKLLADR